MAAKDDIPHEPSYEQRLAVRRKPVSGDVVPVRPPRPDDDDEGPTAEDIERFGSVTVTCKECGQDLFDDAAVCWNCGRAVLAGDRSGGLKPWVVLVAVLVVIGLLWGYFAFLR
jgi:hypothetical protein